MSFTIEPMINAGKRHIKILPDQWTAVTKDHKLSAQWEHTLMVTADGFEIFTLRAEENFWVIDAKLFAAAINAALPAIQEGLRLESGRQHASAARNVGSSNGCPSGTLLEQRAR